MHNNFVYKYIKLKFYTGFFLVLRE